MHVYVCFRAPTLLSLKVHHFYFFISLVWLQLLLLHLCHGKCEKVFFSEEKTKEKKRWHFFSSGGTYIKTIICTFFSIPIVSIALHENCENTLRRQHGDECRNLGRWFSARHWQTDRQRNKGKVRDDQQKHEKKNTAKVTA